MNGQDRTEWDYEGHLPEDESADACDLCFGNGYDEFEDTPCEWCHGAGFLEYTPDVTPFLIDGELE